jgi:hypothetical protein
MRCLEEGKNIFEKESYLRDNVWTVRKHAKKHARPRLWLLPLAMRRMLAPGKSPINISRI